MSILNSFQKITRVRPGLPFGDGHDGALTISADTNQSVSNAGCSGSAATKTLTLDSAQSFADGDVVLIWQTRGTGAGQWEINKIVSGGGTTTLTLLLDLNYDYANSGASQAQVYELKEYTTVVVDSGKTWSPNQQWDENKGGLLPFAAKLSATFTGKYSTNGYGFLGGVAGTPPANTALSGGQGEGTGGARGTLSTAANGNGGGGGNADQGTHNSGGAGGGGNNAAGTAGTQNPGGSAGSAGAAVSSSDLITFVFGGAGGAGGGYDGLLGGDGGDGAGGVIGYVKDLVVTGSPTNTGVDGAGPANTGGSGGGGGAGGSNLFVVQTATLGSGLITASAGAGGNATTQGDGGAGDDGAIAIHHSGAVTGTTSPSFTDVEDTSLVEATQGLIF